MASKLTKSQLDKLKNLSQEFAAIAREGKKPPAASTPWPNPPNTTPKRPRSRRAVGRERTASRTNLVGTKRVIHEGTRRTHKGHEEKQNEQLMGWIRERSISRMKRTRTVLNLPLWEPTGGLRVYRRKSGSRGTPWNLPLPLASRS